jgi:hypothetical protein
LFSNAGNAELGMTQGAVGAIDPGLQQVMKDAPAASKALDDTSTALSALGTDLSAATPSATALADAAGKLPGSLGGAGPDSGLGYSGTPTDFGFTAPDLRGALGFNDIPGPFAPFAGDRGNAFVTDITPPSDPSFLTPTQIDLAEQLGINDIGNFLPPEGATADLAGQLGINDIGNFVPPDLNEVGPTPDFGAPDLPPDYGGGAAASYADTGGADMGDFASGGSFTVPRTRPGTDTFRASMNLTGGERVSVSPADEGDRIGGRRGGGDTFIINIATPNPQAFAASRASIRRQVAGMVH